MPESLPRRDGTLTPKGAPRYDALYASQLMTVVMGVGFDEGGANRPVDDVVEAGLLHRGFVRDDAAALARLQQAGRPVPQGVGAHLILRGSEANGQRADVVLTLLRAADGSLGRETATAFIDGMNRCDVAIYGGHGRYGTGPDFDYNFTVDLLDEHGEVTASFRAYQEVEAELAPKARAQGTTVLDHYNRLLRSGRLVVRRVNGGNLVINLRNYHSGEFGSYLMVDQLKGDPNIRRMSQQRFSKKYRVWLFHGCRTSDYFYNLRTMNPEANAGGLEVYGTRRLVYWSEIGNTLLSFLDGLLRRQSHKDILTGLAAQNPSDEGEAKGPSHVVDAAP